jgi:hypothetical protein
MRSAIPIRIPNMKVEPESIQRRIYPAIAPTLRGIYVRLRLNLQITRIDFAIADITGLFYFILTINAHHLREVLRRTPGYNCYITLY